VNFLDNPLSGKANWMGSADDPLSGFSWKAGSIRDTTGIIIWSDIFLHQFDTGEKIAILLMDTQGLFDSKTTPADNSRIFALGTLISSVQVVNLNGVIQEDQLQYLQVSSIHQPCRQFFISENIFTAGD
jgi:atlastin